MAALSSFFLQVLKGFSEAQVENVELYNMGQLDTLGN